MSTFAYYHPREMQFDLADMPTALYAEVVSLHGHIRRGEPVFTCLDTGDKMYVCRSDRGRFFIRHYPGAGHGGHPMSTMSDEHRRQADYTRRAAAAHGLDAVLEKSTGNRTRLDVAVFGHANTGFEIQRSQLSRAKAKQRALDSFTAGWHTAWVSDSETDPGWADHVPTARLTMRGWDEMPPANTAHVVIGDYVRERDKGRPTGWWYRREPKAVLLDELAYLMPAGEIAPVAVGTQGMVDLSFKAAVDVIDSCTYPGASQWNPTSDTPRHKETVQHHSRRCEHAEPPREERSEVLDGRETIAPQQRIVLAPPYTPLGRQKPAVAIPSRSCKQQQEGGEVCGRALIRRDSIESGICRACHGLSQDQARRLAVSA